MYLRYWVSYIKRFRDLKYIYAYYTCTDILDVKKGKTKASYNMVDYILGGLGLSAKNITQKPASHFLYNSLAELVRHTQAQKCP